MPNSDLERSLHAKLAELSNEQQLVKSQLDRERLATITSNLIETITSPKFVERMRTFRTKAGTAPSFEDAADLMSLESLRAAGANIPDDFRLTSRVFEDSETGMRVEITPPKISQAGGQLAWGACAGGGAATVCGCAGGST